MILPINNGGFTTCIKYWFHAQEVQLEENLRLIHEASPALAEEHRLRMEREDGENDLQDRITLPSEREHLL
jgi:hypothetical protein